MRESGTRYVLLGVLAAFGPQSGYDIKRIIDQSISNFWSESFGQIYPQLRLLSGEGLVEAVDAEAGARERRRFRITRAGRTELSQWAARPPRHDRTRSELLLKLMFGAFGGREAARAMLTEARDAAITGRDLAEAGQVETMADGPNEPGLAYYLIVTDAGRIMRDAYRRWAERALQLLDADEAGGGEAVLRTMRRLRKSDQEASEGKP
jgi:PadR family transcriptional regulator, regulatory protein AphA